MYFNIESFLLCNISNHIYLQFSTYFVVPLLSGLIPVFIASFFGFLAFRNVRRIVRRQLTIVRRRLDRQMTAMVAIRIIILFSLTLPYLSYRMYTFNYPNLPNKPMEYARGRLIYVILFFLFNLNFTISFYIYVILSSRFRRQVKSILLKKYWQLWKCCCCAIKNNRIGPENPESFNTNMDPNEND
ncbi:unnamed protein product [Adineta steineri]|uniref:G-protein coupled receptors family 1 profile domain-containing protein n=1 Tax=Adineta steineri TaxID=433720 RepID=A0A814PGN2_9BILA|nr:unnamed protein product [Adineta steineri]CAF1106223.1 unnamed protein product [Adineta steineri]CAF1208907.1 unnamed protein product [Adineta steineri]